MSIVCFYWGSSQKAPVCFFIISWKERVNVLDKYKDVLSIDDLCEILHIGKNTAYNMLKSQQIPCRRIGNKKYIIPKEGVISYLNGCINLSK